ncbi:KLH10 protein, partial [Urocolius indicus]|nr:KLH10 protein [Urocolius indicus]
MERKMSGIACNIFNELRLEKKFCDVIITVDGVEFSAHKNILCTCSTYFRSLFTSSWDNSEKQVYNIPGVSPEMMQLIIEYAYTRSVEVTDNNVQSLLAAADQFNVTGLIRLCCTFLKSQLCLQNCIGIFRLTGYYYLPELREEAFMFILHHFEDVAKESPEFGDLSIGDLERIIERDELNVTHEETVFKAIVKWISHDPQNRKQHIAVLLSKVRLGLVNEENLMRNIKKHNYVQGNEECKALIISTLTYMYNLNQQGTSCPKPASLLSRRRLPFTVLFAIGGWSEGSPTNAVETYDTRADNWMMLRDMEEDPIAYHGAAYLKGFIYIIGGFDSIDYFNNVKRFDLLQKKWQQVAPMHSRRCYVSVAVLDGFIYAMGGFDGHMRLNTAEQYEPETNQWTLIAPMHEQRSDASATTLNGKVYICGGFNGHECLITAEAYNPMTRQWSLITPMRSRRSGVGVIAYRDKVYAVGGFDGSRRLWSAEAYSPDTNMWNNIPHMFSPRSNFGIEVVDDTLFVVGGFNGFSTTLAVECYYERSNEWYEIQDMNINRSALSCCVVPGLPNIRDYVTKRD